MPADQRVAESALLHRRDLGRGWIPVPMVNNDERVDPYGDDDASAEMRAARDALVLTALDEGQAWRRRDDGALVVLRVEAFAGDAAAIRARWSDLAEPCLDAVWRQRWREREREPGWIEARWRTPSDRPDRLRPASPVEDPWAGAVDWLSIEDHTEAAEAEAVTVYDHVTIWAGRWAATLVGRHRQGADIDGAIQAAALALAGRLATGAA
ncbi:MAG: hypothetical protein R2701_07615 [Acidimicrobiales bacterium]